MRTQTGVLMPLSEKAQAREGQKDVGESGARGFFPAPLSSVLGGVGSGVSGLNCQGPLSTWHDDGSLTSGRPEEVEDLGPVGWYTHPLSLFQRPGPAGSPDKTPRVV
jgi:hypothetical protein